MNALTKVLVFLVLVLSVGFAASQMVLFDKREELGNQYATARERLDAVVEMYDTTSAELSDTKSTLSKVRDRLSREVSALESELSAQKERADELNAALQKEGNNTARLTELAEGLRGQLEKKDGIIDEQGDRIAALQETVNKKQSTIGDLQDTVAQRESKIGDLSHRLQQTKEDKQELAEGNARLAGIVEEFRRRGFDVPPAPAPAINAVVIRVDEELGTAVIDKGSEAEIKPNTQFTIYDDTGFVATLVIHDVWDTVAGGMIMRAAEDRAVEVGDRATTEIQVP